jgi:hypothetical protein
LKSKAKTYVRASQPSVKLTVEELNLLKGLRAAPPELAHALQQIVTLATTGKAKDKAEK